MVVRVHVRQPNVKEQGKPVNFHSDRPILAENPIKNRPINARTNKLPGEKAALHQLNNNNNNNNFIYIALKSNNCPKRYLITK